MFYAPHRPKDGYEQVWLGTDKYDATVVDGNAALARSERRGSAGLLLSR